MPVLKSTLYHPEDSRLYLNRGRHTWEGRWGTAACAFLVFNIQRASSMNSLGHATLRSVSPSRLQTPTMANLPPTERGDIADVPQAGERTCLPSCLQWVILSKVVLLCGHAQYFSSSWAQLGLSPDVLNLMREIIMKVFFFFVYFDATENKDRGLSKRTAD